MNPHNEPPTFDIAKRLNDRHRQLGTRNPECGIPGCDETNPFALTGHHPDIICYEHKLLGMSRTPYEAHHVAGQHNSDLVADIPGNDHRILSEYQASWPEDTLRNPDKSPLLIAAAAIRGWLDVLRIILERCIVWIPGLLEWLNDVLVERHGRDWWIRFGWNTPF